MNRLLLLLLLPLFALGGCVSNGAKYMAEAGAFQPDTCTFPNGTSGSGAATCQSLARAYEEEKRSEGRTNFAAAVAPPATEDPSAWWKYYDSVEDGPAKVALATSAGGRSEAPIATPQADLARTALVTESNERVAWISGGLAAGTNVATAGLATISNIVRAKFDYKRDREMWAAFSRPNVKVSAGGTPGGEFGEGASASGGDTIVNVDSAFADNGSRAANNRDGFQGNAHDDGATGVARNQTDPTFVNGACDEGDSQCDDAQAPFLEQQNPTNVDPSVFGRQGFGR